MLWFDIASFALVGALFLVLGWASRTGRLRPNPWAGIRIPSLDTPEKWRAGHRAGAPAFLAGGTFSLLLAAGSAVAAAVAGPPSDAVLTALSVVWVISLVVTAVVSAVAADRAASTLGR